MENKNCNTNKAGFTIVELLIVVGIIGILVGTILIAWGISVQNKAAINSYKTTMKSVQTAVELCTGTGGIAQTAIPGGLICSVGTERYPTLPAKCGLAPFFCIADPAPSGGTDWAVTTASDPSCSVASAWSCKGCRMVCTATGCSAAAGSICQ